MPASPDLVEDVREHLARRPGPLTPHRVADALRASGRPVGDATVLAVHEALRRDVLGAGPLEPLLRLPDVTDVLVNGPHEVYVDRGSGLERTEVTFTDDAAVRRLAQRLASAGGRRLDDSVPHVDVRLADGTRFHAVLAPLARPGTVLVPPGPPSARAQPRRAAGRRHGQRPRRAPAQVPGLPTAGLPGQRRHRLGQDHPAQLPAVPGRRPTSGSCWSRTPSELRPDHPHVVGLEARPPNIEGAGEVTLRTLVRQALRMRPDRLVVGEVRGAEVVELMAALNTGHEGGCGTIHANSARDVPARVEALALAAGLGRDAAHSQLLAGPRRRAPPRS